MAAYLIGIDLGTQSTKRERPEMDGRDGFG
jgi:hypothetical protein